MASSNATTVQEYLDGLPDDRRAALQAVRQVIRKNLPRGFVETVGWGMICYSVPLSRYPDTYNGQPLGIAALASQKNHMAVYLMGVYGDPETERWFREEYRRSGKKLDMGKSCVRFSRLDQLALDVIGKTIARIEVDDFIAQYEASRGKTQAGKKDATRKVRKAAEELADKPVRTVARSRTTGKTGTARVARSAKKVARTVPARSRARA